MANGWPGRTSPRTLLTTRIGLQRQFKVTVARLGPRLVEVVHGPASHPQRMILAEPEVTELRDALNRFLGAVEAERHTTGPT